MKIDHWRMGLEAGQSLEVDVESGDGMVYETFDFWGHCTAVYKTRAPNVEGGKGNTVKRRGERGNGNWGPEIY